MDYTPITYEALFKVEERVRAAVLAGGREIIADALLKEGTVDTLINGYQALVKMVTDRKLDYLMSDYNTEDATCVFKFFPTKEWLIVLGIEQ